MEHTLQKVEKNSRRHLRGATSFQRERKPPTPSSGWGPWGRGGEGATGNHEGGYIGNQAIARYRVMGARSNFDSLGVCFVHGDVRFF